MMFKKQYEKQKDGIKLKNLSDELNKKVQIVLTSYNSYLNIDVLSSMNHACSNLQRHIQQILGKQPFCK